LTKETISRGTVGFVHPITGSYFIIDDDGNIRIGLEATGDCFFVKGTTGDVYIKANKFKLVSDDFEWNNLVMNKSATNPSQPAFIEKQDSALRKELSRYGN
jgi:hypothetical protein